MTSPPYWGLRDYKVKDQIGLEETPDEYTGRLVEVFRDVRRVLRSDGVVWLNLGDSYAGGGGQWSKGGRHKGNERGQLISNTPRHAGERACNLKPGDLVGIPWRVAFALQQDGWWLRSANIWAKPNPMPTSQNGWRWERCRVKVGRHKAVKMQAASVGSHFMLGDDYPFHSNPTWADCPGCPKCASNDGLVLRYGSWRHTTAHEYVFQLVKSKRYFADAEAVRERDLGTDHPRSVLNRPEPTGGLMSPHAGIRRAEGRNNQGRNPRSVWTITPKPYRGAHFATFPPDLVEKCIGSAPLKVCGECGAAWAPIVLHRRVASGYRSTCACSAPPTRATVLDPFGGSGTTAMVARRMGRRGISLDLSLPYSVLGKARLAQDR